ncbi:MAG: tryptophan synthase subunit alpha [Pseudomonadales bacterium]
MSRISDTFARRRAAGQKLLIPYLVAGDPNLETSLEVMHAMVDAGADVIEVGVPFTDPEAEGPSIQLGHERALKHNVSLTNTLGLVEQFRQTNNETPIILMGYVNPIEAMGFEKFASRAAQAGVDGTIIVNLPPEEGIELSTALKAHNLAPIYLMAPTTTDERAAMIVSEATEFIYYVSLKGTTGASNINFDGVEERVAHLRTLCPHPIVVGFGIKDGASAARVASFADGSVVGTAIVDMFAEHQTDPAAIAPKVVKLLQDMRQQMDAN